MEETCFAAADPVAKLRWLARVLADPEVTTAARAVAAALAVRHNTRSGRLDPGAADLAALAGLSRRGAQYARDLLVKLGHLEKLRRQAGANGQWNRTNAYRLAGVEGLARLRRAAVGGAACAGGGSAAGAPEPSGLEPMNELGSGRERDGEGEAGGAETPWRRMRAVLQRRAGDTSWWRGFGSKLAPAGDWAEAIAGGRLTLAARSSFVADYARREEWRLVDAALAAGLAVREVRIVV